MSNFEREQSDRSEGGGSSVLIEPRPMRGFVQTPQIKEVAARALNYLRAGFPVHFRGPTGAGKTTLALHVAHKLRRPMVLIHGDDQFTSADLTGKSHGYSRKKVIDEFVRGVSKTEESMQSSWVDHRLTVAVREGHTLLYDEFNRSRPEANNILLSVLQEGVLDFPVSGGKGETYLQVHPDFRVIFTSNPEEYAGVHKTQDALLDRMVTIDLEHYNHETEVRIAASKSHLSVTDAEKIVSIVRELRSKSTSGYLPTVRGCIMVAKSVKKYRGVEVSKDSEPFRQICHDVLVSEITRTENKKDNKALRLYLDNLIDKYCLPTVASLSSSDSSPDSSSDLPPDSPPDLSSESFPRPPVASGEGGVKEEASAPAPSSLSEEVEEEASALAFRSFLEPRSPAYTSKLQRRGGEGVSEEGKEEDFSSKPPRLPNSAGGPLNQIDRASPLNVGGDSSLAGVKDYLPKVNLANGNGIFHKEDSSSSNGLPKTETTTVNSSQNFNNEQNFNNTHTDSDSTHLI